MKAVMITYNESIDAEVSEAVLAAGQEFYTKFTRVLGSGPGSGPRLDTTVWPGANNAQLLIAEDEQAARVVDNIKALREQLADTGLRVFWWAVEGAV